MAKYRILCTTFQSYWFTVEAPDRDAARKYYDGSDGTEFHESDDADKTWELSSIEEVSDDAWEADLVIDEEGELLAGEGVLSLSLIHI